MKKPNLPEPGKDVVFQIKTGLTYCGRGFEDEGQFYFQVLAIGGGTTSISADRVTGWFYAEHAFNAASLNAIR